FNIACEVSQITFAGCGLHFNRAERVKHPLVVEIRCFALSPAVLNYANASFEPSRSGIRVCPVAGGTRTEWARCKTRLIDLRRPTNCQPLIVKGQKTAFGLQFRIPIFVSNPWHSPVDIRGLRAPQLTNQLSALSVSFELSQDTFRAKVS